MDDDLVLVDSGSFTSVVPSPSPSPSETAQPTLMKPETSFSGERSQDSFAAVPRVGSSLRHFQSLGPPNGAIKSDFNLACCAKILENLAKDLQNDHGRDDCRSLKVRQYRQATDEDETKAILSPICSTLQTHLPYRQKDVSGVSEECDSSLPVS